MRNLRSGKSYNREKIISLFLLIDCTPSKHTPCNIGVVTEVF